MKVSQKKFPLRIWQLIWYICIFVTGCVGNGIVIYVTFKANDIQRKAPFNVYVLTLSIVDLLISAVAMPIYILSTSVFDHPSGTVGEWLCKICTNYFLIFYLIDASTFLLCAIAVERRKAILKPYSILQETHLCKTLGVIFFIFLLSFITQTPTIYRAHYSQKNGTIGNVCAYNSNSVEIQLLHYASFLFNCVVPTIIMFLCFCQINQHLSRAITDLRFSLGAYENAEEKIQIFMKKRKRTIELTKMMVLLFLICVCIDELFYLILRPVTNLTKVEWNSPLFQVAVMLRISNSFVNPILFSFKSKVFRRRLQDTFGEYLQCQRMRRFFTRYEADINAYYSIQSS